jgi:hypothetical protein
MQLLFRKAASGLVVPFRSRSLIVNPFPRGGGASHLQESVRSLSIVPSLCLVQGPFKVSCQNVSMSCWYI